MHCLYTCRSTTNQYCPPLFCPSIRRRPGQTPLAQLIAKQSTSVPRESLVDGGWIFNDSGIHDLITKLRTTSQPLAEAIGSEPLDGFKSGLNEAYYLDDSTASNLLSGEPQSKQFIKALLRGRDVKRWNVSWDRQWHIVIPSSQNRTYEWSTAKTVQETESIFARLHPKLYAHLKRFEEGLRSRTDQGKFWWELRSCDYYEEFDRPKIAVGRIAYHSAIGFDEVGYFQNNSTLVIPSQDLFILGVLNSSIAWWYMTLTFPHKKDEALSMDADYMAKFPIPHASEEIKAEIRSCCQSLRLISARKSESCRQIGLGKKTVRVGGKGIWVDPRRGSCCSASTSCQRPNRCY